MDDMLIQDAWLMDPMPTLSPDEVGKVARHVASRGFRGAFYAHATGGEAIFRCR